MNWRLLLQLCCALVALVTAGCVGIADPPLPPAEPGVTIAVGETLTVTFSDLPPESPEQNKPFVDKVKEDGTITLLYNKVFKAEGKTHLQLQSEIHDRYIDEGIFRMVTVTVKGEDRFYYVDGEVKQPSQFKYSGPITLTGVIATAGGFTDFAAKTRVQLSRGNSVRTFDYTKILKSPKLDPPILPNDRIYVPRRGFSL